MFVAEDLGRYLHVLSDGHKLQQDEDDSKQTATKKLSQHQQLAGFTEVEQHRTFTGVCASSRSRSQSFSSQGCTSSGSDASLSVSVRKPKFLLENDDFSSQSDIGSRHSLDLDMDRYCDSLYRMNIWTPTNGLTILILLVFCVALVVGMQYDNLHRIQTHKFLISCCELHLPLSGCEADMLCSDTIMYAKQWRQNQHYMSWLVDIRYCDASQHQGWLFWQSGWRLYSMWSESSLNQ